MKKGEIYEYIGTMANYRYKVLVVKAFTRMCVKKGFEPASYYCQGCTKRVGQALVISYHPHIPLFGIDEFCLGNPKLWRKVDEDDSIQTPKV